MNCRDVREVIDSFLSEQLLTETNHEIVRHLETCPDCRAEAAARGRIRAALRTAFTRAPQLQASAAFTERLRSHLRAEVPRQERSTVPAPRWLAFAAGIVLTTAASAALLLRSVDPSDVLARDAIADHRNCALKFRADRKPVPLEEAAQRFDSAYRLLISSPPNEISTPNGPARVLDRHSCAWAGRRFGHVVLRYRDRVVSLLMTANDGDQASAAATPRVIGRSVDGLAVVSVDGSQHVVVLVGDLDHHELIQLSTIVSMPLLQQVTGAVTDQSTPMVWFLDRALTLPAETAWR